MVLEEGEDDMPDLAVGAERTTGLDADEDIELMLETMLEDEEEEKEIEDETQREDMNDEEQKEEARITEHGLKLAGAGRGSALIGPLSKLPRLADGTIDVDALNAEDRKVYNAVVMGLMSEEQMDRYECFRRSSLKEPMRKLIQVVVGHGNPKNTDKVVIALAGVAKVFVGELIEEARKLSSERGEKGPLTPLHIQEAYQKLTESGLNEAWHPHKRRLRL